MKRSTIQGRHQLNAIQSRHTRTPTRARTHTHTCTQRQYLSARGCGRCCDVSERGANGRVEWNLHAIRRWSHNGRLRDPCAQRQYTTPQGEQRWKGMWHDGVRTRGRDWLQQPALPSMSTHVHTQTHTCPHTDTHRYTRTQRQIHTHAQRRLHTGACEAINLIARAALRALRQRVEIER